MRAAFTRAITLALPLAAFACAIDDRDLTVVEPAILLLPDPNGFIDGSNAAGIVGYWGYYVDTPICLDMGYAMDQCSLIDDPAGGPLRPSTVLHPDEPATGHLCVSGVAAQVLVNPTTMQPDFGVMWGAGLQLGLNGGMLPYDAPAHRITGISFEIDSPPANMQIMFPAAGSNGANDAYWGGQYDYVSPVRSGLNIVRWEDVAPRVNSGAAPFDPHTIAMFQIHVNTYVDHATPFDFCVWNIAARTD